MDADDFGDRMKLYESQECDRYFTPLLPIYARLDGRSFHTFTKGFDRPFDAVFNEVMVNVVKFLVSETNATLGYTQSDEISLCWVVPDFKSEAFFNRRIFKMTSVLSGLCSAKFNQLAMHTWPDKTFRLTPCFDARVYTLPNETELVNCFLWREQDAVKNSISMAAQAYFSHKELHGKNGKEKQEMLFTKGVNFNDYPVSQRRGSYVKRKHTISAMDEATRLKIPELSRPPIGATFSRSSIEEMHYPILSTIKNRVGVLIHGEEPMRVIAESNVKDHRTCDVFNFAGWRRSNN